MFPTVPLALRQYGTLLLGVVRIHSKQVEYFFQDCRNLETGIRKAFSFTNVNLLEDATHAPYYSITLPETFELIDFDEDPDLNRFEDTHIKSHEVITLEDQMLTCEDQYVANFIDKDTWRSSSKSGEVSGLGAMPMETETSAQSQNPSPKNQAALDRGTVHDDIPQNIPEIEIMCDTVHDHGSESVSLWPDHGNDVMEPDKILEEQIMKHKETASLLAEEMVAPGGKREEPPSAISAEVHEFTNPQISFGHQSPDLALRSTPPPKEPKARRRKRKLDNNIVLSNIYILRYLNDTSELKHFEKNDPFSLVIWRQNETHRKDISELECREKKVPLSLVLWKRNKRHRKDEMLFEPLITGLCDDLCNIYKEDFFSAKVMLASSQDLNFLDQDDDTLIGYLSIKQGGTPECDTIPARTRAVAQFLQGQSPVTPISKKTGDLSLNTILEGKIRKICARMFFETLVLENCGLVDVNQNEPYGDITLKVTSKMKERFSM